MSNVTNVMMQFSGANGDAYEHEEFGTDFPNLALVQKSIVELGDGAPLKHVAAHGDDEPGPEEGQPGSGWGGRKYPETTVLAGAFNYLQLEEFIEALQKLTWREPDQFRLFVQGQDADAFGVWIIRNGKIVEVVEQAVT